MKLSEFNDIELNVYKIQNDFQESTKQIIQLIEKPANLLLKWLKLICSVARDSDDERFALEVLVVAFRRIIASYVLLKNGLFQESPIPLRNCIELLLVALDITFNKASLNEWKNSDRLELTLPSLEQWYFKRAQICRRIQNNQNNTYPQFCRDLVLGKESQKGRSLCGEWKMISNIAGHEHAQSQIRQLFIVPGQVSILTRATPEIYRTIFQNYRLYLMDIIRILNEIPEYRERIKKHDRLFRDAVTLSNEYNEIAREILNEDKE